MDFRTIFKNLWLALTIFAFFSGGYFIAGQHYKEVIEVKERRHKQEVQRVNAEAELMLEHYQREAAEKANQAILEHQRKSRERENEIYKEMAQMQRKFTDNRTLIKQLHESQASLCNRGVLPPILANVISERVKSYSEQAQKQLEEVSSYFKNRMSSIEKESK